MKYIVHNPDFKQNIIEHCTRQEFMKHIGCELTVIEPGYVEAEMPRSTFLQQQMGLIHGGVIATMADVAAGFAAFTLVSAEQQTVTVELKTSYLYPANGTALKSEGKVLKQGSSLIFSEAEVFSLEQDVWKLVAKCSGTFAIVTPAKVKST